MKTPNDGAFFIAPFALDGELMGLARWHVSDLSPKWIDVCRKLLQQHGSVFRVSFGQMFGHFEVKLTSSGGAGFGVFYANDEIDMFLESLRSTSIVQRVKACEQAFAKMLEISERPLNIVVAWANPNVARQDYELVKELSTHFAAAFFWTEAK
jgi:hypothetical protein